MKKRIGFAAMDPALQREIASSGGKAAHAQGRAHQYTSFTGSVAGRKGGETRARNAALKLKGEPSAT